VSGSVPEQEPIYVVAWAFQVAANHCDEFESAYGPNGDWVRLFRRAEGYLKTELHCDPENAGRYITLDFWRSHKQYEVFKDLAKSAYQEIDTKCERLTQDERLLGEFSSVAAVRHAFSRLTRETQLAPAISVRLASAGDIRGMIDLEQSAPTAAHWTEAEYEMLFDSQAACRIVLIAETPERQLCGFVIPRITDDECELENIVVTPGQTRHGTGSALLSEFFRRARAGGVQRIFLEVRESNVAARALYEKLGFVEHGRREEYYSDPSEAAMLYSLSL
jgi:ribosomal-protein-alanine acetyltransferase